MHLLMVFCKGAVIQPDALAAGCNPTTEQHYHLVNAPDSACTFEGGGEAGKHDTQHDEVDQRRGNDLQSEPNNPAHG
jgi:hypothetical protein